MILVVRTTYHERRKVNQDHWLARRDPSIGDVILSAKPRSFERFFAAPAEAGILGALDLMIAAHAIERGAVLVTSDRAFGAAPGLSVEDWTAA